MTSTSSYFNLTKESSIMRKINTSSYYSLDYAFNLFKGDKKVIERTKIGNKAKLMFSRLHENITSIIHQTYDLHEV